MCRLFIQYMREKIEFIQVGQCGERVCIGKDWLVVDIGSGHLPNPRANVLVEFALKLITDNMV